MKTCKVEGCNCKVKAKGYCSKHYTQLLRYGEITRTRFDPNEIIEYEDHAEIILYNKQCEEIARALIDLEDVDKVKEYKWHISHGYVRSTTANMFLHRLVMDCPEEMVIDHINHDTLDNRKSNLRVCTKQQNNMNKSFMSNNTSGYIGVHWANREKKWISKIIYKGKEIHLGYFNIKEDAIQARINAEIEYFGEYRNINEDVI